MTQFLIQLYTLLLHLYPRQFYTEFSQEMQSVFAEVISSESELKSVSLFLHELIDLPGLLIKIYAGQWFQGGGMNAKKSITCDQRAGRRLMGRCPFWLLGLSA